MHNNQSANSIIQLLFSKEYSKQCQEKNREPKYSNCKPSIIPNSFIIIILGQFVYTNNRQLTTDGSDNLNIVLFTFFLPIKLHLESANLQIFISKSSFIQLKSFIVTKVNVDPKPSTVCIYNVQ